MIRLSRGDRRRGLTLVELIVAFTILLILSTMALPVAKVKVRREKERRLRDALYEMRQAIDRYKDAADEGLLGQVDPDNHGYPESLEILVEGVQVNAGGAMPGQGQMGGVPGMNSGRDRGPGGQQSSFGGRNSGNQRGGAFGSRNSRQGSTAFGNSRNNRGGSSRGFGGGMGEDEEEEKTMRFLRKVPIDPMTCRTDWGMRSVSDPPDAMTWGGDNVFDVYSLSMQSSLDGELYSEW